MDAARCGRTHRAHGASTPPSHRGSRHRRCRDRRGPEPGSGHRPPRRFDGRRRRRTGDQAYPGLPSHQLRANGPGSSCRPHRTRPHWACPQRTRRPPACCRTARRQCRRADPKAHPPARSRCARSRRNDPRGFRRARRPLHGRRRGARRDRRSADASSPPSVHPPASAVRPVNGRQSGVSRQHTAQKHAEGHYQ
jgi:hypothetical protein